MSAAVSAVSAARSSRVPGWLDLVQSLSGLALGLFMWGHMFFVSSILIGFDAMWVITKMFEGYFFLGRSYPWIVSIVVAGVWALFVIHAALALRKFPSTYQQYARMWGHSRALRHSDTSLWLIQVITGFALFFMAPVHLYQMLMHPDAIGPLASSDRVWSGSYWPLYLLLLFAVELHGGIGLYRLAVKWGNWTKPDPKTALKRLRYLKWSLTAFFLILGLCTLAAYMKIGAGHADAVGERYTPSWVQPAGDGS